MITKLVTQRVHPKRLSTSTFSDICPVSIVSKNDQVNGTSCEHAFYCPTLALSSLRCIMYMHFNVHALYVHAFFYVATYVNFCCSLLCLNSR